MPVMPELVSPVIHGDEITPSQLQHMLQLQRALLDAAAGTATAKERIDHACRLFEQAVIAPQHIERIAWLRLSRPHARVALRIGAADVSSTSVRGPSMMDGMPAARASIAARVLAGRYRVCGQTA
ncbi:hypothetical protein GALL_436670 [mine drainage metagenome]|uniref:Uncharacterized protein n=1 Tax=mine drainage metagenome TaxID=410659 RepID=A0A1J5PSU2_9ZZZZ